MLSIITTVISYIVLLAVSVGLIFLGKMYVFPKVRVNKFIPLAVAIILLVIQFTGKVTNTWIGIVFTIIILVSVFWFLDILQTGGPKAKEKQIKMKPKAKPNRVKHMKDKGNPKA